REHGTRRSRNHHTRGAVPLRTHDLPRGRPSADRRCRHGLRRRAQRDARGARAGGRRRRGGPDRGPGPAQEMRPSQRQAARVARGGGGANRGRAPRPPPSAYNRALGRARLYLEAGADAIFPEALGDAESFRRFAREIKAPLLANMTEFGRTPYFTARQFEEFGFKMVIWPASS